MDSKLVFFFDGFCGICNWSVDFIIRHDKQNKFKFAALQDTKAQNFFASHGHSPPDLSTSVLFADNKFYFRSGAAFRVAKELGFPWSLFSAFRILPVFLTDFIYSLVAHKRYTLFGKRDSCRLPTNDEKHRFL